jgi:hypothetical protein
MQFPFEPEASGQNPIIGTQSIILSILLPTLTMRSK